MSAKSKLIMIYALCGFANLGSLGIMIGGMGSMAPERRSEIISLGIKSIVSGTLATLLTGAIVGLIELAAASEAHLRRCAAPCGTPTYGKVRLRSSGLRAAKSASSYLPLNGEKAL